MSLDVTPLTMAKLVPKHVGEKMNYGLSLISLLKPSGNFTYHEV
jgi:hypothetical protein